jgi:hypothetical protein
MASDKDVRLAAVEAAAALQQRVTDKMTTLQAAEAHTHICTIALLLEEEQAYAATLEVEVAAATLQLVPTTASSSIVPPPPASGGDIAVVTMLHAQAYGVHNIHSLVSTALDPSSTCYVCWRDQVLLTLKRYELGNHVLSDTLLVNGPTKDRMDTVILSWIFGTITGELQDIAKEHGVIVHQIWRTIEHQFIGNSETRMLHLDTTFCNFVQGDL